MYAERRDFLREVMHSMVSSIMLAIMACVALSSFLRPYTFIYTDIYAMPLWWLPLSVGICLILHDTYFYWMHRLLHNKKIFKLAHVVHHRSTNPSPWASYSFHFIEAVLEGAILIFLVFMVPLHPLSLILFTFSSFVINVYGHLGYEIMPKKFRRSFLFGIINTSTYHNLHHKKFIGNYGLYFRFWDRIMKTENPDYVTTYDELQKRRFDETR